MKMIMNIMIMIEINSLKSVIKSKNVKDLAQNAHLRLL